MMAMETIFALSSGQPPAGIGVIRLSGPDAGAALSRLAGSLPEPRRASLRTLRDTDGSILDQALILWLPGPATVTGEDMAELHVHGGRAVIAAVRAALALLPGLREAEAGEFTRRAFANGRLDLAEAEGLADLLGAETELQRRSALAMAGGSFSRQVDAWRDQLLILSATVEATLDFSDEGDVGDLPSEFAKQVAALEQQLADWLARPRAEVLREGFRVVIAGPANAGKSTLFNALVESEAAITSPMAGTTRDALMRPVAIAGVAFSFIDTAGLRAEPGDPIEAIGIQRALDQVEHADLVLWLGPEGQGPEHGWEIDAQCDRADVPRKSDPRHRISAVTGEGVSALKIDLADHARLAMPKPGDAALNDRQHGLLTTARSALREASLESDPLIAAEQLREARVAFDRLVGRAGTEEMLDTLFGRLCIGK
jgi:tRNA modification GTPase